MRKKTIGKRISRKTAKVGYTSKLTSKYQATVPQEIRKHLHLRKGDRIFYELLLDGTVVIRKTSPLDLHYLQALDATMNEWETEEG